jgi:outer membrane protein
MKTKLILTTGLLLLGLNVFVFAQSSNQIKIGYTNVEYVVTQLPEYAKIESELKTFGTQLQRQLESKVQSLRNLENEIRQNENTWARTILEDKMQDYQNQMNSIQQFQQNADNELQKKQMQLLNPVYEKIEKAIQDVAKEGNFTHVFSDGMGTINILLYARDEDDITNLVLKKMGVTPPPTAEKKN